MEELRVSDQLPFCIETETAAKGTRWNSTTDAATLVGPSATAGKEEPSHAAECNIFETISGHSRFYQARESGNDVVDRGPPPGITEEKCRLEVEEAYAPVSTSETCETPRSSECHTGATAGDSTAPSCSDMEAQADTFSDHEPPIGKKCFRLDLDGTYSPGFSRETSECHTGAMAGDNTLPYCSGTEAGTDSVADHELAVDVIEKKCSRLEMEHALSLAVFSETCESLSRSKECDTDAAAGGDSTIPPFSDEDEHQLFEAVSMSHTTGEGPTDTEEPYELCAADFSTVPSEIEESVWKEIRHVKRRLLQGNKPSTKRLPRVALVALFDAVDAFIGDAGSTSPGPASGARGSGRGSGTFLTSRRCGPASRVSSLQESQPPEEAHTGADVWTSKHLSKTLEAISSRLENVERSLRSYRSDAADTSREVTEEQKRLLLEVERKMVGVMSQGVGEQRSRRTFLQAEVELLARRLLRLRDALRAVGGAQRR
ncbi:uncharacterized protein LOC126272993 isoform X2 [Schistocerca gregaria]|uniref:uncharacterized protein LOC126272993 isoform X2 n=1 Tax=Schistocerca gregaria TaxID=7010 RepID=UPI00211E28CF|nr:uncharacterized protein LOC126272993 isoform X2 [Schistocerca gregaria]